MEVIREIELLAPVAYIDGGSGSMIFQVILATFLTAGYVVRTHWSNIVSLLQRSAKKVRVER